MTSCRPTNSAGQGQQPDRDPRWFVYALAIVAAAALAIRVAYILMERRDLDFGGDAYSYHAGANLLVEGKGFISPYAYRTGLEVQSADHPPLYLLYLGVPSLLGMTSVLAHLLWSAVLGTATVVLVGMLARAVAGARAGIIAAVLAAIYPSVWAPDGSLEAETLAMFLTALTLVLAYYYLRRPSWMRLAVVGASCGAAALTRSELALLVPLLIVPLALRTRAIDIKQRMQWLGVSVLTAFVVVAPWVGYNLSRFDRPVFLSAQLEPLLASANCDTTYFGSLIGYFSIPCASSVLKREHLERDDESKQAAALRREAIDYVTGHTNRLPLVVAARIGRTVGVFNPGQQIQLEVLLGGRERGVARASMYGFYAMALLAVVGGVVIRRRRATPLYPLLAVLVLVLVTVVVTYANLRFRAPAEVVVVVLAAAGVDAGFASARARGSRHP